MTRNGMSGRFGTLLPWHPAVPRNPSLGHFPTGAETGKPQPRRGNGVTVLCQRMETRSKPNRGVKNELPLGKDETGLPPAWSDTSLIFDGPNEGINNSFQAQRGANNSFQVSNRPQRWG